MELFSPEWLAALSAIVLVDLLLAGDNAIVIALAARNLPPLWQRRAIIAGTAGAIIVRVIFVFFVSKLLTFPGLGFVGGLLLYWIAWGLLKKSPEENPQHSAADSFWAAMSTIIVADTVMGLDNILAIAAAAKGDFWLIAIGLGLSVPVMMFGSVLILKVLEKAPWLVVVGAGVLAIIAGQIILADAWIAEYAADWNKVVQWLVIFAVAVLFTTAAVWSTKRHK